MRLYGSEHNDRWVGFEHRGGDIVISTRSKCGTTWVQMICLLLVHQTPKLPAPIAELSPWLDWDVEPLAEVTGRLDRQQHRRVIKTHTPLDGLPLDERVTYIVVGRHPLDVAVSLFHHGKNIDRDRTFDLTGVRTHAPQAATAQEFLDAWIDDRSDPVDQLDTLAGNLHHISDAWFRTTAGNVLLLHYDELQHDIDKQVRDLAVRLDLVVPEPQWAGLIKAAGFESMKARADTTAPDRLGTLKDRSRFFRGGSSGEGRRVCTEDQSSRYDTRVRELAEPDLLRWLHHHE